MCCLDMLPISFLKSVFNCVTPKVLHINTPLKSGHFSKALKTAVRRPLFKTLNLDTSVNY